MPVTWNVQPYQFFSELNRMYTQTIIVGTRGKATQMAEEATLWMREHAPWKDTDVVRMVEGKRVVIFPAGTARQGLRAYVMQNRDEIQSYRAMLAEAKNTDKMLLDQMNEQRRTAKEIALRNARSWKEEQVEIRSIGKGRRGLATYVTEANPAFARKEIKRIKSLQKYKPLTSVPKGQSAVAALEKSKAGLFGPLVEIRFAHRERLPYAIWLEIANGGKYSIISKALDYWSPRFMREIQRLSNLVQYQGTLALGPVTSVEEQFAQNAREYEFSEDKPYKPFDREEHKQRLKRRRYYDPDKERERRESTRAYHNLLSSNIRHR